MTLLKAVWTHDDRWKDGLRRVVLVEVAQSRYYNLQYSAAMRSPTLVPGLSLPCTRHEGRWQVGARREWSEDVVHYGCLRAVVEALCYQELVALDY
jgi:hypothetical protein